MKKITKNKHGFTLVEMVLVVAILLILASALVMNVSMVLGKGREASLKAESDIAENKSYVNASETKLASFGFVGPTDPLTSSSASSTT